MGWARKSAPDWGRSRVRGQRSKRPDLRAVMKFCHCGAVVVKWPAAGFLVSRTAAPASGTLPTSTQFSAPWLKLDLRQFEMGEVGAMITTPLN